MHYFLCIYILNILAFIIIFYCVYIYTLYIYKSLKLQSAWHIIHNIRLLNIYKNCSAMHISIDVGLESVTCVEAGRCGRGLKTMLKGLRRARTGS